MILLADVRKEPARKKREAIRLIGQLLKPAPSFAGPLAVS